MVQKKMIMKKDGKEYKFQSEDQFWYNNDLDTQMKIFLDASGLWIGKFKTHTDGTAIWEKQTDFEFEMDEGTLHY